MRPLGWYIGWLGHDNLGDEAMWELCRERFCDVAWHPYEPPAVSRAGSAAGSGAADAALPHASLVVRAVRALGGEVTGGAPRTRSALGTFQRWTRGRAAGEVAILGGGTIINHDYVRHYRALRARTGRPVPVFASGVGNVAFWTEKRPEWRDRRREWVEAFAELPIVGVRGPLSCELLREAGATNVEVVGDPALLLRPSRAAKPLDAGETPRIGINIGVTVGGATTMWGSPDDITRKIAELARRLLLRGFAVELFAVWPKDLAACAAVVSMVGDSRLRVARALGSANEFLNYVQDSYDIAVAFKLHAGVLAAAANVPPVVLEYRPKCRDFALSIGWGDFTRRTDEADADWMEARIDELLHDLPGTRRRLATSVDNVRRTLDSYLTRIAPLLR